MSDSMNQVPSWAKYGVGYLCFVDSFSVGQGDIEKKKELYEREVYDQKPFQLKWEEKNEDYHFGHGFYGGDLNGISKAVESYLKPFGVNMLYITPVFEAESNHKYDTIDYKKIDPQFGTLEDFRKLVKTCNNTEIKLIIDGVFNHTSSKHPWYQKAATGDETHLNYYQRNLDGFIIKWNGVEMLPVLNQDNPAVREYLYTAPDSVLLYWLSEGVSGWRLDVAERLTKPILKLLRKSMKSHYPDKLLIGEVVETYGKEWIADGYLDGLMNYVFRGVTANFLTGSIDGVKYLQELSKMFDEYPREQLYASWNLISTHDTNRMLYDVGGNESLFKMAVVLQFTYPGVPFIYYGDEIGMKTGQKEIENRMGMDWKTVSIGQDNPWRHNRGVEPMEWEKFNRYNSYYEFYKHIIWLKKTYPVLTEGEFVPLSACSDALAYLRVWGDKFALVVVNRGMDGKLKIEIPESIAQKRSSLRGVFGYNGNITLDRKEIEFGVYATNSYIFVND